MHDLPLRPGLDGLSRDAQSLHFFTLLSLPAGHNGPSRAHAAASRPQSPWAFKFPDFKSGVRAHWHWTLPRDWHCAGPSLLCRPRAAPGPTGQLEA